jgi:hypothetical protein
MCATQLMLAKYAVYLRARLLAAADRVTALVFFNVLDGAAVDCDLLSNGALKG